jgi:hypothetical protein
MYVDMHRKKQSLQFHELFGEANQTYSTLAKSTYALDNDEAY